MTPGLPTMRRIVLVAAATLALSACDMVSSVKEGMALSEQAAEAIAKKVGDKPQVGFNYNNNTLVSVSVVFQKAPSLPVEELEKIARKEVRSAFKVEPTNLVLSFVFAKAS